MQAVDQKAKLQGIGAVNQPAQSSGPIVTVIMPQLPLAPGEQAEVIDAEVIELEPDNSR